MSCTPAARISALPWYRTPVYRTVHFLAAITGIHLTGWSCPAWKASDYSSDMSWSVPLPSAAHRSFRDGCHALGSYYSHSACKNLPDRGTMHNFPWYRHAHPYGRVILSYVRGDSSPHITDAQKVLPSSSGGSHIHPDPAEHLWYNPAGSGYFLLYKSLPAGTVRNYTEYRRYDASRLSFSRSRQLPVQWYSSLANGG